MGNCGKCHKCGTELRRVLDGEEWCQKCGQYRRYRSHGWIGISEDSPCEAFRSGGANLLPGKTCRKCKHFSRCKWLLSREGDEIKCDWYPSRFLPVPSDMSQAILTTDVDPQQEAIARLQADNAALRAELERARAWGKAWRISARFHRRKQVASAQQRRKRYQSLRKSPYRAGIIKEI